MHLQIIIGSVRERRKAKPVGDWAYELAAKRGDFTVELIDLKEWDLPFFDQAKPPASGEYTSPIQQRWAAKVAEADAYLLISPEYNSGYSPALKNALDWVYAEWNRKPATVVTYGGAQGARSAEQIRQVLVALQIAPLNEAVFISNAGQKFSGGKFVGDDDDVEQLTETLDSLLWWAKALSAARKGQ